MTSYDLTNDFEFILEDRLSVIQQTDKEYDLENNAYISFSGGKDSTLVHYLIDMALPNNKIPRVFIDTGIEYNDIREFVYDLAAKDNRFVIIKPQKPIIKVLQEYGYPFKSKQHSHNVFIFQNNKEKTINFINQCESNPKLLNDYDFIHNLPNGVKTNIKYIFGVREKEKEVSISFKDCPESLKYQFTNEFNLKLSDKCCYKLKKEPAKKWQKYNNKNIVILGLKEDEGGMRSVHKGCVVYSEDNKSILKFKPLNPVSTAFEDYVIAKYDIKLCKLYYPPYNFKRTGCKGCSFALDLQDQLNVMATYLPNERKQCEFIWKPVYEEYRRLGYRLKKSEQLKLF